MLFDSISYENFKVFVKFGGKWTGTTKFWKFAVDSPDDFYVIMLNKLQIFLLILFRIDCKLRIQLQIQFTLFIFFPIV